MLLPLKFKEITHNIDSKVLKLIVLDSANFEKHSCSNSLDIMRQTACLVVNPIIVDGYALLFNCTTAVRASDSMAACS